MDEMKITSALLTGIISKLLKKTIMRKCGIEADIRIQELRVSFNNEGKAVFRLNAEGSLEKEEFMKLMKRTGLD